MFLFQTSVQAGGPAQGKAGSQIYSNIYSLYQKVDKQHSGLETRLRQLDGWDMFVASDWLKSNDNAYALIGKKKEADSKYDGFVRAVTELHAAIGNDAKFKAAFDKVAEAYVGYISAQADFLASVAKYDLEGKEFWLASGLKLFDVAATAGMAFGIGELAIGIKGLAFAGKQAIKAIGKKALTAEMKQSALEALAQAGKEVGAHMLKGGGLARAAGYTAVLTGAGLYGANSEIGRINGALAKCETDAKAGLAQLKSELLKMRNLVSADAGLAQDLDAAIWEIDTGIGKLGKMQVPKLTNAEMGAIILKSLSAALLFEAGFGLAKAGRGLAKKTESGFFETNTEMIRLGLGRKDRDLFFSLSEAVESRNLEKLKRAFGIDGELTPQSLKKQYNALANKYHSDKTQVESEKLAMDKMMAKINEARSILAKQLKPESAQTKPAAPVQAQEPAIRAPVKKETPEIAGEKGESLKMNEELLRPFKASEYEKELAFLNENFPKTLRYNPEKEVYQLGVRVPRAMKWQFMQIPQKLDQFYLVATGEKIASEMGGGPTFFMRIGLGSKTRRLKTSFGDVYLHRNDGVVMSKDPKAIQDVLDAHSKSGQEYHFQFGIAMGFPKSAVEKYANGEYAFPEFYREAIKADITMEPWLYANDFFAPTIKDGKVVEESTLQRWHETLKGNYSYETFFAGSLMKKWDALDMMRDAEKPRQAKPVLSLDGMRRVGGKEPVKTPERKFPALSTEEMRKVVGKGPAEPPTQTKEKKAGTQPEQKISEAEIFNKQAKDFVEKARVAATSGKAGHYAKAGENFANAGSLDLAGAMFAEGSAYVSDPMQRRAFTSKAIESFNASAEKHIKNGEWAKAGDSYKKAAYDYQERLKYLTKAGDCYARDTQYSDSAERASNAFNDAADICINPAEKAAFYAKAGAANSLRGSYTSAVEWYDKAMKTAASPEEKAAYAEKSAENYAAARKSWNAGNKYKEGAEIATSPQKKAELYSKAEESYLSLRGEDFILGRESAGRMYADAVLWGGDPSKKSEYQKKVVEYLTEAGDGYFKQKAFPQAYRTYLAILAAAQDNPRSAYFLRGEYIIDMLTGSAGRATPGAKTISDILRNSDRISPEAIKEPATRPDAKKLFLKAISSKDRTLLRIISPAVSFGEILKIEDRNLRAIAVESKTSMQLHFGDLEMQRKIFDEYANELAKPDIEPYYAKICGKILANIFLTTRDHDYLDRIVAISKKKPVEELPRIIASISEADLRTGEINALKMLVRQGLDEKMFKFFAKKLIETGYLTKSAGNFLDTGANRAFLKELIARHSTQLNTTLDTILKTPGFDLQAEKQTVFAALDDLGCVTPVIFQRYRLADKKGREELTESIKELKAGVFKNKPIKDILPEKDIEILDELVYTAYLPKNISYERMQELLRGVGDHCEDIAGLKFPENGYSLSFRNKSYALREGEKADIKTYARAKGLFDSPYPDSKQAKDAINEALLRAAKAGPDFSDAQIKSLLSLLANEWLTQNVRKGYDINDSRSMYRFLSDSKELITIHTKDVFAKKLIEYLTSEPDALKSIIKTLSSEANQKTIEQQLGMKGQINWALVLSSTDEVASILSTVVTKKVCTPELKAINRELKRFQETRGEGEVVADEYKGYVSKNAASFFAKAAAGLCTSEDVAFYTSNSNYFHINIVKNESQVVGNVQAYVVEMNGRNVLLLRGFNPTESMLSEINPSSFCEEVLIVARQFVKENGLAGLYITENGSWHALSNRSDVSDYLKKYTTPSSEVPFNIQVSSTQSIDNIYRIRSPQ